MSITVVTILGIIVALAATVLSVIYIVPESKRSGLKHPVLVFLHDLFNFKSLWIEKIMKFLYILATCSSVAIGFFMLFWFEEILTYGYDYNLGFYTYITEYKWFGYYGLILMIIAPIVIRIVYEFMMMLILLVKNTIEINNKMPKVADKDSAPAPSAAPTSAPTQTPVQNEDDATVTHASAGSGRSN